MQQFNITTTLRITANETVRIMRLVSFITSSIPNWPLVTISRLARHLARFMRVLVLVSFCNLGKVNKN